MDKIFCRTTEHKHSMNMNSKFFIVILLNAQEKEYGKNLCLEYSDIF